MGSFKLPYIKCKKHSPGSVVVARPRTHPVHGWTRELSFPLWTRSGGECVPILHPQRGRLRYSSWKKIEKVAFPSWNPASGIPENAGGARTVPVYIQPQSFPKYAIVKVVAFLCVCALLSLQLFVIFEGFKDMSPLECQLCFFHRELQWPPLGTFPSTSHRAPGRRRDGEGAGVRSHGEERVIYKRGDLKISLPQEV